MGSLNLGAGHLWQSDDIAFLRHVSKICVPEIAHLTVIGFSVQ